MEPHGIRWLFEHVVLALHLHAFAFAVFTFLLLAGSPTLARSWGADGTHGRHRGSVTAPVHNLRELREAEWLGARLLFVSPVFATRSHAGAKGIGRLGLARLVHQTDRPVVALGGMTHARFKALRKTGVWGWAAIDGLSVKPA